MRFGIVRKAAEWMLVAIATLTVGIGGAYLAGWIAWQADQTEGGWILIIVALPIGFTIGALVGLYGSIWLASRLERR